MANIPIWAGSATFDLSQNPTPFGFYDSDTEFQTDAPKVADWCAQRLGYPLVDIELQQEQFFAAFEEAITEYGSHLYQFQVINNMIELQGFNTGSADVSTDPDDNHLSDNTGIGLNNINISGLMDNPTGDTQDFSNDSATGGTTITGRVYSASLQVKRGKQKYNLLSYDHKLSLKIKKFLHLLLGFFTPCMKPRELITTFNVPALKFYDRIWNILNREDENE